VPTDPFSGEPFRYRVSSGEQLKWRPVPVGGEQEFRDVARGQGVVWSTGPDLTNNGGWKQGDGLSLSSKDWSRDGLDVIFLVPRWPAPPGP
jgi:hypothetical protein